MTSFAPAAAPLVDPKVGSGLSLAGPFVDIVELFLEAPLPLADELSEDIAALALLPADPVALPCACAEPAAQKIAAQRDAAESLRNHLAPEG